jgi:hypothetical protein
LKLDARQRDGVLSVTLGEGLREGTAVRVWWPSRTRPRAVRVDGRRVDAFDADGVLLPRAFKHLEARW